MTDPMMTPGQARHVAPGVRRVLAPNPSPLTGTGTNTYVLGTGEVALIDPGPDSPAHLNAILAALTPGERIAAIIVTHAHLDHSALATALSDATGAPVMALGGAATGRSARMKALAASGGLAGGEGVDAAFRPDHILSDGETLRGTTWALTVLHTPGHFGNHISLLSGGIAFTGDHVMGWSTSLVSPPDGDMAAYMASLARLAAGGQRTGLPGHGPVIADLPARIAELTAHRRAREAAVLAALAAGPADAMTLARVIYTDTDPRLIPAAARNVLAHLVDLADRNLIGTDERITAESHFHRL